MPHPLPFVVVLADPRRKREQVVGRARTYAEACRKREKLNKELTAREGVPTGSPFEFAFVDNPIGNLPSPRSVGKVLEKDEDE